jgi:hypothetical protein
VVNALEIAVKALKKQPQGFNGRGGFALFEWLDDASRNALLCSTESFSQSSLNMVAGNVDKANEVLHLSQACIDASTLIYTVSENAGALYERYVAAEEKLAAKGLETTQRCVEALKKSGAVPKK